MIVGSNDLFGVVMKPRVIGWGGGGDVGSGWGLGCVWMGGAGLCCCPGWWMAMVVSKSMMFTAVEWILNKN